MKIIFMGTPWFSAEFLRFLCQNTQHEIVAVVTQPDRPSGRGQLLHESEVKIEAMRLGLPVLQPDSVRNKDFARDLSLLQADVSVVVAFSLLPQQVLLATRLGAVNVHGSLLPRYRGAAPVQWAIAQGEHHTGVTIFRLDAKMDHGPVLCQKRVDIHPEDTTQDVLERMVDPGCSALHEALQLLEAGGEIGKIQDESKASPARKLGKEDGLLDWNLSAKTLHDRIRAFSPWPGGYSYLEGVRVYLRRTRHHGAGESHLASGELLVLPNRQIVAGTPNGWLEILELQAEGKKVLPAEAFLRGWHRSKTDAVLRFKS